MLIKEQIFIHPKFEILLLLYSIYQFNFIWIQISFNYNLCPQSCLFWSLDEEQAFIKILAFDLLFSYFLPKILQNLDIVFHSSTYCLWADFDSKLQNAFPFHFFSEVCSHAFYNVPVCFGECLTCPPNRPLLKPFRGNIYTTESNYAKTQCAWGPARSIFTTISASQISNANSWFRSG